MTEFESRFGSPSPDVKGLQFDSYTRFCEAKLRVSAFELRTPSTIPLLSVTTTKFREDEVAGAIVHSVDAIVNPPSH